MVKMVMNIKIHLGGLYGGLFGINHTDTKSYNIFCLL